MSEPFIGQVMMAAFNFAPRGWAFCNGQLMAISQNTALFSILGLNYGGDGKSTFGLPDLRGSAVVHAGTGQGLTPRVVGETGGVQDLNLLISEMPRHTHQVRAFNNGGDKPSPQNNYISGPTDGSSMFSNVLGAGSMMNFASVAVAGGSMPHDNMQPYLAITFCIALEGIFPARG